MNRAFLILPRCFPHTFQPVSPASPALSPALVRLFRVLLGQRPSLHNLLRRSPALVRLLRGYYAAVRLPAAVHGGLRAHRLLHPARHLAAAGSNGASRFSRMEFLCVHGVFDSAGRRCTCAGAHCVIAFRTGRRGRLPGSPFRSSIPGPHIPLSNASSAAFASHRPRMARGQGGSLFLPCMTLSFTTPCRFIPTLSSQDWLPHSRPFRYSNKLR